MDEVFPQDEKRNQSLSPVVKELGDVLLSIGDNGESVLRMVRVVVNFLCQVRVIVPKQHVVIVGHQFSLHEPAFKTGDGGEGQRVGGHNPNDAGGHIVALETDDEFVSELLIRIQERSVGGRSSHRLPSVADVGMWELMTPLYENLTVFPIAWAPKDCDRPFFVKGQTVPIEVKKTIRV